MPSIYSVYQVNSYIKNMFAQDCMLGLVCVRGEASNVKYHSTGHVYFTLKDDKSSISCVMFSSSRAKGLKFQLEEGQLVVAKGGIQVYERDGKYQLYAKEISIEGEGDLNQRFLALKQELYERGMFDQMYKQPIPRYIKKLGVVTAQTGAAIQDIINITRRRNPYVQIILAPALVQGEGAPESIVSAIKQLEQIDVDTIIVGRGGGSMEDLFCFNDEQVAQAIFDCPKPIISAVGHEIDITIADFVSDMRAPTPSAAAELAVYDYYETMNQLNATRTRMYNALVNKLRAASGLIATCNERLKRLSPESKLAESRRQLEDTKMRLQKLMDDKLSDGRHQVMLFAERLKGLSPLEKLTLGYSRSEDQSGHTISSISQVKVDDSIKVYVSDGYIDARVLGTKKV